MIGDLHQQRPARYPGHDLSIGDPCPDRPGPHPGGGILFIDEPTFEDASLHTFDGNDYFRISITTRALEILMDGVDFTYP